MAELTAPLYAQSLSEALGALDAAGDAAGCAPLVSGLATRQQQLGMGADAAAEALGGAVRGSAAEKLGEACKALRVQDSAGAVSSLRSLLDYADRTTALVEAAGAASESGAPLYAGIGDGVRAVAHGRARGGGRMSDSPREPAVCSQVLRDAEVLALYRLVLLQALQSKAVSAADAAALESLRLILGMSEVAAARVYEAAAGPIYRSAVEEAVAGELSAAAKQAVAAALADLALPASSAASIGLEVYSARLSGMVENGAILSEEQSEQLQGLRAFLGIEDEAVYAVHEQACAKAYRTSVKQVMGNAGAIPDEYWSGLDTLRERMVLSPDTAQALFVEEAQAKMCEFGTRALEALQEAQKEAQKGDSKGDKGIGGAVSSEVLNLVDFALAARVLTPQSADGVEAEVAATSLKGKFEQRALNELYRQYLIEAFGGSDEAQNQRLLTSLGRLALVLGLESHEVNKVHNELGSIIIRRYAGNAIKAGPLGATANPRPPRPPPAPSGPSPPHSATPLAAAPPLAAATPHSPPRARDFAVVAPPLGQPDYTVLSDSSLPRRAAHLAAARRPTAARLHAAARDSNRPLRASRPLRPPPAPFPAPLRRPSLAAPLRRLPSRPRPGAGVPQAPMRCSSWTRSARRSSCRRRRRPTRCPRGAVDGVSSQRLFTCSGL